MTVENAVKNNGGKNMSYNEFLPSYSIGDDCYKEIPYVTRRYGKTAVVIGGKTAMEKAKPELLAALKGSDLEITDFIWYGGDSNYENIEMLKAMPEVQNADMVFGVGGGRAVDTVKTLCDRIDKPFFTFPTLASNCASCNFTLTTAMMPSRASGPDRFSSLSFKIPLARPYSFSTRVRASLKPSSWVPPSGVWTLLAKLKSSSL